VWGSLRVWAARDGAAEPFGFEQFQQRCVRTVMHRRAAAWSATGSVLALGLVSLMAVLTQPPAQPWVARDVASMAAEHGAARGFDLAAEEPALVDLDQFDLTAGLEDHIALLDDALSAARVRAVPAERLRQMESAREQLSASLQQVSYAQSMLSL
jgi:hypothetical protein